MILIKKKSNVSILIPNEDYEFSVLIDSIIYLLSSTLLTTILF